MKTQRLLCPHRPLARFHSLHELDFKDRDIVEKVAVGPLVGADLVEDVLHAGGLGRVVAGEEAVQKRFSVAEIAPPQPSAPRAASTTP